MSTEPDAGLTQRIRANPLLLILGGVAVLALLAACVLGGLLLRSTLRGQDNGAAAGEPTPFPTSTSVAAAPNQPVIVGVSDTGTVSVTLDVPLTLGLADRQFNVTPQNIGVDGLWSPTIADENEAAWVNGTIVNYVLGVQDTPANRATIESLAPGDQILLTTRQNQSLLFTFDSRQLVPATDRSVFNQQAPGVTLLVLGSEGADRLVVRGRFELSESDAGGGGNVVQLGETAQLGDVQITANNNSFLTGRPEAPPGFAFLLVDFTMQNLGLSAVDTNNYRFFLSDELGNQYALSPLASRLGNNPPLSGFINAGQSVAATAGYQIPAGLVSPTLTWTVTEAQTGAQIKVVMPFTAGGQAGESATVALQGAEITPDLNNLIVSGLITNIGAQPLVVTREDVTLRTINGSDYLLLATNPAFPWTIPPGQTLQFAVTYQRPLAADAAIFTILSQPFQLSGLQSP